MTRHIILDFVLPFAVVGFFGFCFRIIVEQTEGR